MSSKYATYRLEELVTIKYGKNQKKVVDEKGKYPIYGTGGLMGYAKEFLYDKPSVLIGRKGSISKVKYVEHPFWTVDTLFYTIVNEEIVLPRYLYYIMSNIDFSFYNEGTTIPSLRTDTLNKIEFNIPTLEEQKAIAKILSDFDAKIEVNNQISKTLEEMAQALFKHWFVEFEFPSEQGEPYKSSGGEMIESELGMIPKGWEVTELKEFAEIIGGGTPKTTIDEYWNGDIGWITPKDLSGYSRKFIKNGSRNITELGLKNSSAKILKKNTILFSSRAPIGYMVIAKKTLTTNQGFKSIQVNDLKYNEYVYYYIKKEIEAIKNSAGGSTFKEVSGNFMKQYKIVVPERIPVEKFKVVIEAIDDKLENIYGQNDYLTQLRDTLLPKLMSGEIRVTGEQE